MFYLRFILDILKMLANMDNKSINFVLDNCLNIEYDIDSNNLILSFNKMFFKSFKNNILFNINSDLKLKNPNYPSNSRIECVIVKIWDFVEYDYNIIKISIPFFITNDKINNRQKFKLTYLNLLPLKVFCNYIYNSYHFKGLSYKDKKELPYKMRLKAKTKKINPFIINNSYYYKIDNSYYNNGHSLYNCYMDIPISGYQYKNEYKTIYNFVGNKKINNKKVIKFIIDFFDKMDNFNIHKTKDNNKIMLFLVFKDSIQWIIVFNYKDNSFNFVGNKKFLQNGNTLFDLINYYHYSNNDLKVIKLNTKFKK